MKVRMLLLLLIIGSVCFLSAQSAESVLMKVGKSEVTVGEFRYIYEKNNGKAADYSAKSLAEYIDLYTKFKLKVSKAREMQLDTISELMQELEGYRKQLASSYLMDKEVTDFLLRELFDRTKEDVEFSHIFIPVAESAPKSVREEAKNKLRDVRSKIVGGMSFEDAARKYSEDKVTAEKGGYMGYFTAKLPSGFYHLESALYQTKPAEVSDIIETRIGYHIVKVQQRRPARGTIEVAHILVKADRKALADSLSGLLAAGADFDVLALNYSQDKTTSKNGGKLPPFGINVYDRAFEDGAFSIRKDGVISSPVLTKSGWHLIKRMNKPQPDSYEVFVRKMKSQISKDQRFEAGRSQLIADIKKAAGYQEDRQPLQKFISSLNEEFYSYKWVSDPALPASMLFSLGGNQVYTLAEFAAFCKKNTRTRLKYDKSKPYAETVDELFQEFVNETALAFEEKNLAIKYPDFKSLMREYEEGILLFEATRIHVWDKANQDTVGLKKFYALEKGRYIWPEKATVAKLIMSVDDKKQAEKIHHYLVKHDVVKAISKFNTKKEVITVQRSEAEKGSKEAEGLPWSVASVTPLVQMQEGKYACSKIEKIDPSRIKTLSEARGYVVADYQDVLEKEWVASLGKEFNVIINQDVLQQLEKK